MTREDCIYFEEKEEDTGLNHCTRTRSLNNDGKLCDICKLWDSYIPNNSTHAEIEKAQKWQRTSYSDQPDYDKYFSR